MDELRDSALAGEVRRIEESAMFSGQSQFEQAKLWRGVNLVLGGPAAVLAALSGATGLADAANRTTAAVLALVAAALGAVMTTLNASSRAERAHAAANAYLAIQTDARQFRLLDLPDLDPAEARARLATLTARQQEANDAADIPSRLAYLLGRRNIRRGGQTYAADE